MKRCIDAGREGCPCTLAESGNCLVCSRLQGGTCDDCCWQGTCIYTLYEQNRHRIVRERQNRLLPVRYVRVYGPNLKVFVLEADKGFCQKAGTAGAFVFVKTEQDHDWFGAPISVLKAEPEKGLIHLAVCACGPKTNRILQETNQLSVRGIYYNALAGQSGLLTDPEETFVFAKGVAIAPLRNYLDGGSRYRRQLRNLQAYIDLDKTGMDFFLDYFGDLPASAVQIRNFAKEGLCSLDQLDHLESQALSRARINVLALTSPYYVAHIQRAVREEKTILRPAEGNMCCGEGICGACTEVDRQGRTIRNCKAVK